MSKEKTSDIARVLKFDASAYGVDEKSLRIYELYREKITHEDSLVNFRTTWFVALQAFLFTSLALSLDKLDSQLIQIVPKMFAGVGLMVAATSFTSVLAAIQAINKTTEKWTQPYHDHEGRNLEKGVRDIIDPKGLLPAIKGAGSSTGIAWRGNVSSLILPWIVALFWAVIIFSDFSSLQGSAECGA